MLGFNTNRVVGVRKCCCIMSGKFNLTFRKCGVACIKYLPTGIMRVVYYVRYTITHVKLRRNIVNCH